MAEQVIERRTYCPTGNPADEVAFEVVIVDDDARPLTDSTPRTTNLVRLFSRGNRGAIRGRERDYLVTTARGTTRTIRASARVTTSHIDVDLTSLGLTLTLPFVAHQWTQPFDLYRGPARGAAPPTNGTLFDTYKVRVPR